MHRGNIGFLIVPVPKDLVVVVVVEDVPVEGRGFACVKKESIFSIILDSWIETNLFIKRPNPTELGFLDTIEFI